MELPEFWLMIVEMDELRGVCVDGGSEDGALLSTYSCSSVICESEDRGELCFPSIVTEVLAPLRVKEGLWKDSMVEWSGIIFLSAS